jgi:hypothetical protein
VAKELMDYAKEIPEDIGDQSQSGPGFRKPGKVHHP